MPRPAPCSRVAFRMTYALTLPKAHCEHALHSAAEKVCTADWCPLAVSQATLATMPPGHHATCSFPSTLFSCSTTCGKSGPYTSTACRHKTGEGLASWKLLLLRVSACCHYLGWYKADGLLLTVRCSHPYREWLYQWFLERHEAYRKIK